MSTRTTPQPKVDLDATRARLARVGLGRSADQLDALIADAVKADVSPHAFLDRLLDEELSFREDRRMRTSLRLSGLPTGQTIGNFDFSFQPSIERSRIETQQAERQMPLKRRPQTQDFHCPQGQRLPHDVI